jgi:hypothetical protein
MRRLQRMCGRRWRRWGLDRIQPSISRVKWNIAPPSPAAVVEASLLDPEGRMPSGQPARCRRYTDVSFRFRLELLSAGCHLHRR